MVNLPKLVRKKLSDVLVDEKVVKEDVMAEALNRQKDSGDPLPAVLQKMGVLPEVELARAICKQYNLPFIDASRYKIPRELMGVIPLDQMKQNQYVILDKVGKALLLAISNLPALDHLEELERKTGSQLYLYVSTLGQVTTAIRVLENPASAAKPGAPAAKPAAAAAPAAKPAAPAAPGAPAAPAPPPKTSPSTTTTVQRPPTLAEAAANPTKTIKR